MQDGQMGGWTKVFTYSLSEGLAVFLLLLYLPFIMKDVLRSLLLDKLCLEEAAV